MDGLYALAGPAAGEEGSLGVVVIGGWPLCTAAGEEGRLGMVVIDGWPLCIGRACHW